jgi:hypothetical protein
MRFQLLQLGDFFPHVGDLRRRRLTRGVPQQPLLARLQKLRAPPVIEIGIEPFTSTEGRDALFAPQSLQDDPNLLLCRKSPPRLPLNVTNNSFC